MRTNNVNYTRLTNTRDVPPVGLGGKTPNIGFGLPNYTTDNLPLPEVSKPGDMVFDTTLMQPLIFDGTSYVALYPPSPPPPSQGEAYASIRQTDPATHAYPTGIAAEVLITGAITNIVAPVGLTVGGDTPARLTNTSGAPITVLINSSVTLNVPNIVELPAAVSLVLIKAPSMVPARGSYFFSSIAERRAFLLNSIVELDVDEYLEVSLAVSSSAETVNITAEQFNFTAVTLPLSYGGLQAGTGGIEVPVTANVPRLLPLASIQSLPFNGILPNSNRFEPRLTNNTGEPINVNICVNVSLVHNSLPSEEPFEVRIFLAKNGSLNTPIENNFSTGIIKILPDVPSVTSFFLAAAIDLDPAEWVSVGIISDYSTSFNNASFYFTMVMV